MNLHPSRTLALLSVVCALASCGGSGSDGPQVIAAAQSLSFGAAPDLTVGQGAIVAATASSGLAATYASATPTVCTVDSTTGQVSTWAAGTCKLTANQAGNEAWAPAPPASLSFAVRVDPRQSLSFAAAPTLSLGGTATVAATASSGLAVIYSSLTPTVCAVQAGSGLVSDLSLGDCIIAADQPGNATYQPAPQVLQTLAVQVPDGVGLPSAPTGVEATLGANVATVIVSVGRVDSGGSPLTGYTVVAVPSGVGVSAKASPITVHCSPSCAGQSFTVRASNLVGSGAASAAAEVITVFDVLTVFYEPDTQPRDSVFTGTFTLNSTTGEVSKLTGYLTESMSGNAVGRAPYFDMTLVPLTYQLQSWRDATLGGSFVASFAKNTSLTFTNFGGGDGWSPRAGVDNGGVYAGFPAPYATTIQNSSILIFVPDDPFAPLAQAQIDKLAYADCAPGGMMGAVCMTATSVAGYGAIGTMSGYPISQMITKR